MSSDNHHTPLEAVEDDLSVARRAYLRASERAMQQGLQVREALAAIARARRALKNGLADDADDDLEKARMQLDSEAPWPCGVRIDDKAASPQALRSSVLSYRGMWRPPAPPESPQALGCHAIVCSCLALLWSAAQVRQHWETGCFDCPDFETDRERETLLNELEEKRAYE